MVHPPTPSKRLTGKKTGERGRAHLGERGVLRPGKHGAADIDALITAQRSRPYLFDGGKRRSARSFGDVDALGSKFR